MSGVRVRRHTDGRVAVKRGDEPWQFAVCVSKADMSIQGWCELLVAELPEPDGYYAGDHGSIPFWDTKTGAFDVEEGDIEDIGWARDIDEIRADALKMLAAVAACEHHRAEAKP